MTVTTVAQLASHEGHKIEVEVYVNAQTNATVTCITCGMILIDFDHMSGRDACHRCEIGTMQVVQWLPDEAADAGYYIFECDHCSLMRKVEDVLPDNDEWLDKGE
jgi:hypothetical protein